MYLAVVAMLIVLAPEIISSPFITVALAISIYGLLLGSFTALLGGVPVYLILRRFNWIKWYQFVIAGVALGLLCISAVLAQFGASIEQIVSIRFSGFALLASVGGAVGGATFWWVVYRHGASTMNQGTAVDGNDDIGKTATKDSSATRD